MSAVLVKNLRLLPEDKGELVEVERRTGKVTCPRCGKDDDILIVYIDNGRGQKASFEDAYMAWCPCGKQFGKESVK